MYETRAIFNRVSIIGYLGHLAFVYYCRKKILGQHFIQRQCVLRSQNPDAVTDAN